MDMITVSITNGTLDPKATNSNILRRSAIHMMGETRAESISVMDELDTWIQLNFDNKYILLALLCKLTLSFCCEPPKQLNFDNKYILLALLCKLTLSFCCEPPITVNYLRENSPWGMKLLRKK
jgi:hypothetical protein